MTTSLSKYGLEKEILNDIYNRGITLHGHSGPFLALGVRMGLLAKKLLGTDGLHGMKVIIHIKTSPPESCILDGLQASTGCTLGRANISVINGSELEARFYSDKREVKLKLKAGIREEILKELRDGGQEVLEALATQVLTVDNTQLFEVITQNSTKDLYI